MSVKFFACNGLLRCAQAAILFSLVSITAFAETENMAFSVASVRENKSDAKPQSNFPLDNSKSYVPTGGTLVATNEPLLVYIIFAYRVNVAESADGLIKKLPDWAKRDRFDITAKADIANPTKDDMRLMMKSLLEERFHISAHRYSRQGPILALVQKKPGVLGPQLKPHDPSSDCAAPPPDHPSRIAATALVGRWPAKCGDGDAFRPTATMDRHGGRDMTMDAIASWLTGVGDSAGAVDRPIINKTGLEGTFDFIFDVGIPRPGVTKDETVPGSDPTFLQALSDQLGLEVKRQDGVATFFSVDAISYPTNN